jgi:hypothetical protein
MSKAAFSRLPLTAPFVVTELEIWFDFRTNTAAHPRCPTPPRTRHTALKRNPGLDPIHPKPPQNLAHVDRPHSRSLLHSPPPPSLLIPTGCQLQPSQLCPVSSLTRSTSLSAGTDNQPTPPSPRVTGFGDGGAGTSLGLFHLRKSLNSGQMYFSGSVPRQPVSRTNSVLHSPSDGN